MNGYSLNEDDRRLLDRLKHIQMSPMERAHAEANFLRALYVSEFIARTSTAVANVLRRMARGAGALVGLGTDRTRNAGPDRSLHPGAGR